MMLRNIWARILEYFKKVGLILYCVFLASVFAMALHSCEKNIEQDQVDFEILQRMDKRTDILLKAQEKHAELGRRIDILEQKLGEVGQKLSK